VAAWRLFNLLGTVEHLHFYQRVLEVLAKYGFEEFAAAAGQHLHLGRRALRAGGAESGSRTRPQRACQALEELGPTFVKLGQLLSTRPDLIPSEYCAEFERLQDGVAPVRWELIRPEIERELGAPVGERFREFDEKAFAAGSIAQMHRAVTREGALVAVKVRRPGIEGRIRSECEMLERLARLVAGRLGRGGPPRNSSPAGAAEEGFDPVLIVREFARAVLKEVDLANERRNIRLFQRHFEGDASIHIPAVYDDYCTRGVLTLEYVHGVKPTNLDALRAAGLDRRVVAERGADFVLRQVFEFGFFLSDPHPGNFFVLPGNVLAPVDFGQAARIADAEKHLFAEFVYCVLDVDAPRLIRAFQRLDMLDGGESPAELARDLDELLAVYHDLPVREMPFGAMVRQTFDLFRRHRLRPPAEFTLMLKTMMTIESLAVSLDGDFQLTERLRPHAQRLAVQQAGPRRLWRRARQTLADALALVADLPAEARSILRTIRRGRVLFHVRHEHLDDLIRTLDKSSDRISFALIIAGLLIGSSFLVTQGQTVLLDLIRLQTLGVLGYLTAAVLGIGLLLSILRGRRP
jgi:ubiquinone biosynthesis protein